VVVNGALDYEASADHSVRIVVRSEDSGTPAQSLDVAFDILLDDVQEPPSHVRLSGSADGINVPEDSQVGFSVGTFSAVDPDGDSVLFSFDSNRNAGLFSIQGSRLVLERQLDASNAEHEIAVIARDLNGNTAPVAVFTIGVGDRRDFPTIYDIRLQVETDAAGGSLVQPAIRASIRDGQPLVFSVASSSLPGAFSIVAAECDDSSRGCFANLVVEEAGRFSVEESEMLEVSVFVAPESNARYGREHLFYVDVVAEYIPSDTTMAPVDGSEVDDGLDSSQDAAFAASQGGDKGGDGDRSGVYIGIGVGVGLLVLILLVALLMFRRKSEAQVEYEVYGSMPPAMANPLFKDDGSGQVYEQVADVVPNREVVAQVAPWYRPALERSELDRAIQSDPSASAFVTACATDPVYDNILLSFPKPAARSVRGLNKCKTVQTDPDAPVPPPKEREGRSATHAAPSYATPRSDVDEVYGYSGSTAGDTLANPAYRSQRDGLNNPAYHAASV